MKKAIQVVSIMIISLASTLAVMLVNVDLTGDTCFLFFVRDVLGSIAGHEALAAVLYIVLLWMYARFTFAPYGWQHGDRLKLCLLALAFAFASSLGAMYRADDGLLANFLTLHHLMLIAGKAFGFFALFFIGMKAILLSLPKAARKITFQAAVDTAAVRRSFWTAWVLIACAWLPSFIAHFPGSITADGGRVLQQYYGEIMITSDHPLAYTYLLGSIVQIGSWLGGDMFGIFLYTSIQWLFLLSIMAWTVAELKREGFPSIFIFGLSAFYALLPMSMQVGTAIIKDIPYAGAFLAYMLLVTRAFLHPREAWLSRRWWLGYTGFSLMILLLRHNGVLVVLPMSVVLIFHFHHEIKSRGRIQYGLIIVPLTVMLLFNNFFVPKVAFMVESSPDMLGLCIQQTARILKNDPNGVSAQDLAIIDQVLIADQLAGSYSSHQSDSVRKLYRYFNDHTQANVLSFALVAAKLNLSHPLTAMHAFWSLSGGFLDMFDVTYINCNGPISDTSPKYPASIHFEIPATMVNLQNRLRSLEDAYLSLPLVSQLKSVGMYAWMMFIGWFLIRRTRERKLAWLLVPAIMTLLACLLSAGFRSGSRYAFPIVFTIPFLCCIFTRSILHDDCID